jgi:hypothetical protein
VLRTHCTAMEHPSVKQGSHNSANTAVLSACVLLAHCGCNILPSATTLSTEVYALPTPPLALTCVVMGCWLPSL